MMSGENINLSEIQPVSTVRETNQALVELPPPERERPVSIDERDARRSIVSEPSEHDTESVELALQHLRSTDNSQELLTSTANGAVTQRQLPATMATAATDESWEDEPEYPGDFTIGLITLGLFLASFPAVIDDSIIDNSIPEITTIFQNLNNVGWYFNAYFLTLTLCGALYAIFSAKYTYIMAILLFEVGSIVCATSVNPAVFVAGRALAGVGTAALFNGGMVIIGLTIPLRKRAVFVALLSSMFGIWTILGGLIGGAIIARLSWRWCFWINLPFGAVALVLIFVFFKEPSRKTEQLTLKKKVAALDLPGVLFLTCGLASLLLGLQWGTLFTWSDPKAWGCLLGFGLIAVIFVGIEIWSSENSTIPPRIMKQRTVAAGCVFTTLVAMVLSTYNSFLPDYSSQNYYMVPLLVSTTITSLTVGFAITKLGYYNPFVWGGSLVFVVGCGLLYLLRTDDDAATWIGYQILVGIGAGACIQIPFLSVHAVLSTEDLSKGIALIALFNALGGIVSSPIGGTIFSNELMKQLVSRVPQINAKIIVHVPLGSLITVVPPSFLELVLEAYYDALSRTFIFPIVVACVAALCSLAFEWKSIKGKNLEFGGRT